MFRCLSLTVLGLIILFTSGCASYNKSHFEIERSDSRNKPKVGIKIFNEKIGNYDSWDKLGVRTDWRHYNMIHLFVLGLCYSRRLLQ